MKSKKLRAIFFSNCRNKKNVVIDGKNVFDQPVKNYLITGKHSKEYHWSGDDYTTGCLLDYKYSKNYYKTMAIDLSKQQALDADLKKRKKLF